MAKKRENKKNEAKKPKELYFYMKPCDCSVDLRIIIAPVCVWSNPAKCDSAFTSSPTRMLEYSRIDLGFQKEKKVINCATECTTRIIVSVSPSQRERERE